MVTAGYLCDVCGKADKDRRIIEAHEKTPIRGAELPIGAAYSFRVPNHFLVITAERPYDEEHIRRYYSTEFFLRDGESNLVGGFDNRGGPFVMLGSFHTQCLGELSQGQFADFLKLLKEPLVDYERLMGGRSLEGVVTGMDYLNYLAKLYELPQYEIVRGIPPVKK